jgi:uncharacterized protein
VNSMEITNVSSRLNPAMLLLFSVLMLHLDALGQPVKQDYPSVTLPNTQVRIITAKHNAVTYKLLISLPLNYTARPDEKFEVIYLLDADFSFALAKNMLDQLEAGGQAPGVILVGIAYEGKGQFLLNRTRDYTPTLAYHKFSPKEVQDFSGGGPKFLAFIRNELFPFMAQNFRVSNSRTIVGHSLGGLFAIWTFLTQPDTFDKYLVVSPSLWYDDYLLLKLEERSPYLQSPLESAIYLAVGQEETTMATDMNKFAEQLKERNHKGLKIYSTIFQDENHSSVLPLALAKGLRQLLH